MNRITSGALSLTAAVGMALALQAPVHAADAGDGAKTEKCYGINTAGKNDCAAGAHSCAGQATQARDPKSFVLLPAGACAKIQGGMTKAM